MSQSNEVGVIPIKNVLGLSEIVDNYDVYFVDLWGVMHNGTDAFPGAVEALTNLQNLDKKVILLSNAPRISPHAESQLPGRGVSPELYNSIYTSGQHCFDFFNEGKYASLGKSFYCIGDEFKDNLFYEELEKISYNRVQDIPSANFILVTGTRGWDKSAEPYLAELIQARELNLPMICVNADRWVMRNSVKVICSGMIAEEYQNMGGVVHFHGKPDNSLYEEAYKLFCSDTPKLRILMIGDSLTTDIQGAVGFGIDSLWVASGIYGEQIASSSYEDVASEFGVKPTYFDQCLRWSYD